MCLSKTSCILTLFFINLVNDIHLHAHSKMLIKNLCAKLGFGPVFPFVLDIISHTGGGSRFRPYQRAYFLFWDSLLRHTHIQKYMYIYLHVNAFNSMLNYMINKTAYWRSVIQRNSVFLDDYMYVYMCVYALGYPKMYSVFKWQLMQYLFTCKQD